jgi:hypothetical protein
MGLRDITREAILAAIAEYDRLGQDEFLSRHGFDRARSYLLIHDGKAYDSKAIVGVAHGFLPGSRRLLPGLQRRGPPGRGQFSLDLLHELPDQAALRLAERCALPGARACQVVLLDSQVLGKDHLPLSHQERWRELQPASAAFVAHRPVSSLS